MSFLELLAKPSHRNLLDILTKLPKLGVGSKVTRKSWEAYGNSYWEVTAVKPRSADGSLGKVWGIRTWRGVTDPTPRHINGRAKKIWRWVPSEPEAAAYKPLVRELQRQKGLEKLAAERAAAAAGQVAEVQQ